MWRAWAQSSNVGDIYILNGVPRIQLVGNALLLVGFMIEVCRKNRITLVSAVLLFGVLAAGNGAFILGIAIFFFVTYSILCCARILQIEILRF